jgi:predicted O-methyltransferase YrrM
VERDPARAKVASDVFADVPQVRVVCANWTEIYAHGPYDLLVLDGGGQAKPGDAADPERLLEPGGVLVVDDFTPCRTWPPSHAGHTDTARLFWLQHPALRTVDLPLAEDLSAIVAVRRTDR